MKLRGGVVTTMVMAACGGGSTKPDAAAAHDSGPDASLHCGSGSGPATHTLYINTEGVTLTRGQCNDSRTNCTSLIASASLVVPPFNQSDSNRTVFIGQIVTLVQTLLAPYAIDVVTTRPASGDYVMVVMGGTAASVGFPNGTFGAILPGCSPVPDALSLIFDGTAPQTLFADAIVSDVGVAAGIGGTTTAGDCMNFTMAPSGGALCTFSTAATPDPQTGCRPGPVDEQAMLAAVYGCR